jgi:serine/threonine protein kinase
VVGTVCLQVLQAVHWIYKHGVLHLDLKLNNFMVASDNKRVVLIDFGCSRLEPGLRRLNDQKLLQPQARRGRARVRACALCACAPTGRQASRRTTVPQQKTNNATWVR